MRDDLVEDPIEWGRQLIKTEDHDPLYSGLCRWGADMRGSRVRRFLLTYWCCYSVGAAWFISKQSGSRYWDLLEQAAANVRGPSEFGYGFDRWPRAHERRHWRGQKCVDSVLWLRGAFRHPEEAVISLEMCRTLADVEAVAQRWPLFGPWISFKIADMLERVLGVPVAFPDAITSLYKDPREGADLMAPYLGLDNPQEVTERLLGEYGYTDAPGTDKRHRPCNVQEVETVLCKWKSARKGHYWLGCDTSSHRKELSEWGATDLLNVYPNGK
ncbi:hypothetical protein EVC26_005 [Rhizobium phage RHph_I72]|nr:hypothetical protein EVC13_005 [Rhizobium phage RHph_I65]QIG76451.1 hypothetical protein EVC26_005 [Rhizobium phage RHph_I72]